MTLSWANFERPVGFDQWLMFGCHCSPVKVGTGLGWSNRWGWRQRSGTTYFVLVEESAVARICPNSSYVPEILQATVPTDNAYDTGVSIKRVPEVSPFLAIERPYRQILDCTTMIRLTGRGEKWHTGTLLNRKLKTKDERNRRLVRFRRMGSRTTTAVC